MGKEYIPPVGPGSERPKPEPSEYIPPVGEGSKSVAPTGDWRGLPAGLLPQVRPVGKKRK